MKINALIPTSTWGKVAVGSALLTGASYIIELCYAKPLGHFDNEGKDLHFEHEINKCDFCWKNEKIADPAFFCTVLYGAICGLSLIYGAGKHGYRWLNPPNA